MKRLAFLSLMACTALLAAEPLMTGKRYDFYQHNGQNLLGAELIEESDSQYTVKLSYVPRPLRIAKQNLLKPPQLSQVRPDEAATAFRWGREVRFNAQFNYTAITGGELHDIFPAGVHAAVGADWHIFVPPRFGLRALSVLGVFSQYSNTPRYIRQYALLAGPQFLIYEWKEPHVIFTGSALAGAANAALTGYTFSTTYTIFCAMGILRAERSFGPVTVGLQLVLNYLFDQSLNFSSAGLGLGVQYAIGRN